MDIKKITLIVNSTHLSDESKESLILECLSKDEEVIPIIMKILSRERSDKKELITDMNAELSRAHIYIDMRPESKEEGKDSFNKGFILDEIAKFYIKYKSYVTHCFNRFV
jgi:hypothetical protein